MIVLTGTGNFLIASNLLECIVNVDTRLSLDGSLG